MILIMQTISYSLIFALLGLGVFISYRIFDFPDMTVDGAFGLGGAIALTCIQNGMHPLPATILGALGGTLAGSMTATLQGALRINRLLSGIIMMTALYSVNLYILRPNYGIVLMDEKTLYTMAGDFGNRFITGDARAWLADSHIMTQDVVIFFSLILIVGGIVWLLRWFFATHIGLSVRATGENDRMVRAMGISVSASVLLGLALANTLAALSGALWAQELSSTDMKSGVGVIVTGLTSVIIGHALFGRKRFGTQIVGVVIGAVLVRLLVAVIMLSGLPTDADRLVQATLLVLALVLPRYVQERMAAKGRA
jgi:putative ABC transport system permease protein